MFCLICHIWTAGNNAGYLTITQDVLEYGTSYTLDVVGKVDGLEDGFASISFTTSCLPFGGSGRPSTNKS